MGPALVGKVCSLQSLEPTAGVPRFYLMRGETSTPSQTPTPRSKWAVPETVTGEARALIMVPGAGETMVDLGGVASWKQLLNDALWQR